MLYSILLLQPGNGHQVERVRERSVGVDEWLQYFADSEFAGKANWMQSGMESCQVVICVSSLMQLPGHGGA